VVKLKSYANVWDALEETPEATANMTMRSDVMIALNTVVKNWNTTQAEAARRLGITQPRLNDLLRGRIEKFSLDMLINLAGHAGLVVRLKIGKAA
jgi:predicted XRE-type DNA-binding protein